MLADCGRGEKGKIGEKQGKCNGGIPSGKSWEDYLPPGRGGVFVDARGCRGEAGQKGEKGKPVYFSSHEDVVKEQLGKGGDLVVL